MKVFPKDVLVTGVAGLLFESDFTNEQVKAILKEIEEQYKFMIKEKSESTESEDDPESRGLPF